MRADVRSSNRFVRFAGYGLVLILALAYKRLDKLGSIFNNADDSRSLSQNSEFTVNLVTNVDELLRAGGVRNDLVTGDRFTKAVLLLVHDGTPECLDKVDAEFNEFKWVSNIIPDGYQFISVDTNQADPSLLSALKLPSSENSICPHPVVIKRRAHVNPEIELFEPLFHQKNNEEKTIREYFTHTQAVHLCVVNDADFDVVISYEHPTTPGNQGEEITFIRKGTITGGSEDKGTTIRARKALDKLIDFTADPINEVVLQHDTQMVLENKFGLENCGNLEEPKNYEPDLKFEEERRRALDAAAEQYAKNVPNLPTFTEIGFKKMRIPSDIMDMLLTYLLDNKENLALEKLDNLPYYFGNNVESPNFLLEKSGKHEEKIAAALKPILEDWSGIELEPKSIYGIRTYTRGSWLANHVDRMNTHVISGIMNIAQDVDEDWPLNIYDHAGNEHNVTIKPGDLVLYESATCLHGRPTPFQGNFFSNIFCHFAPVNADLWPLSDADMRV